jgi:hypothetical protein
MVPDTTSEPDYSKNTPEELDTALEEAFEESGTLEEETTETSDVESATAETSESESVEEPTEPADETVDTSEKLYAGKYKSPEDLEAKYTELESLLGTKGTENDNLQRELTELREKIQGLTAAPKEEAAEPEYPFDKEKFEEMIYDGRHAEAQLYAMEAIQAKSSEANTAERINGEVEEAKEHNEALGRARSREILLESAKASKDAELEKKYSDENYIPVEEDFTPAQLDSLFADLDWIRKNFGSRPITVGGKIVSYEGKWPDDSYAIADLVLNKEQIFRKQKIQTHEETVRAISTDKPSAKVLTATGEELAEVGVKFDGTESELDAHEKGLSMTEAELEAALDESL